MKNRLRNPLLFASAVLLTLTACVLADPTGSPIDPIGPDNCDCYDTYLVQFYRLTERRDLALYGCGSDPACQEAVYATYAPKFAANEDAYRDCYASCP